MGAYLDGGRWGSCMQQNRAQCILLSSSSRFTASHTLSCKYLCLSVSLSVCLCLCSCLSLPVPVPVSLSLSLSLSLSYTQTGTHTEFLGSTPQLNLLLL